MLCFIHTTGLLVLAEQLWQNASGIVFSSFFLCIVKWETTQKSEFRKSYIFQEKLSSFKNMSFHKEYTSVVVVYLENLNSCCSVTACSIKAYFQGYLRVNILCLNVLNNSFNESSFVFVLYRLRFCTPEIRSAF